ncbi:YdbC family protein [Priestia taiwanensis]|uniref:DUF4937 domain-containing protein n=1 Tax=Priestia taiwanensis TaxID=1347902 RepID=A0A917AP06_9BACI|nr:YdbC family protein [Priestia taiwanensis]MBM7362575.1 heme-degrading monooxygenase HmoA [Priestia taiwanensis]GGE63348.1 hypothetical protein GCM10007140_12010 [Priestia taiwanensis]
MFIKWIKCLVNEEDKDAFSLAQQQWRNLESAEGFLGQVGGWNKKQPCEAGIISFWKDDISYWQFMERIHDEIVDMNKQRNTYTHISVELYDGQRQIGKEHPFVDVLTEGCILRAGDCTVKRGNEADFERTQREVWNPGMEETGGILASVFCRSQTDIQRYLAVSIWKSEEIHEQYVKGKVSKLRERSSVTEITERISGHVIEMDRSWIVLPNG